MLHVGRFVVDGAVLDKYIWLPQIEYRSYAWMPHSAWDLVRWHFVNCENSASGWYTLDRDRVREGYNAQHCDEPIMEVDM